MPSEILPISVVIATRDRAPSLRRMLETLAAQCVQPAELVIVDASENSSTRALCLEGISALRSALFWHAAELTGAASQRNQGFYACLQPAIGFFDDDILLESECIARLWTALQSDGRFGGVSAMITNQRYCTPGRISRLMFRLMSGRAELTYAGRVLGPAVNLLPEDRDDLPQIVPVEWLNTTCAIYRREALPSPPFPNYFTGYSMMEDLSLSLTVAKRWQLVNARTARIYHDSQPGSHKSNAGALAEMHVLNRHYVMKHVLGRYRVRDYFKFAMWLAFSHLSALAQVSGWRLLSERLSGECRAIRAIVRSEQARL